MSQLQTKEPVKKGQKRKLKREREQAELASEIKLRSLLHKKIEREYNKKRTIDELLMQFPHLRKLTKISNFSSWKPCAYTDEKQVMMFFKRYVYSYYVNKTLILSYFRNPDNREGHQFLFDIISGQSFYKTNKERFTKAESHYFLSSKADYSSRNWPVNCLVIEARARACGFSGQYIDWFTEVFPEKFTIYVTNIFVREYLQFLYRELIEKKREISKDELQDITDYVRTRIFFTPSFFAGRTLDSIIDLSNQWHIEQLNLLAAKTQQWKGSGIQPYSYEDKQYIYEITELLTSKELINEGRKMKHCVASYIERCSKGSSSIFRVARIDKDLLIYEQCATVEIVNKTIIQSRARSNKPVPHDVGKIIRMWKASNSLK